MANKVIVTCAVTGGNPTNKKHPGLPIAPHEIAKSALEAWRAGAAMTHIHVRDPETGAGCGEFKYYEEVVNRIRQEGSDVVINLTTGPGCRYVPSESNPKVGGPGTTMTDPLERVRHVVELRPDVCSLDAATMNFGETAFVNTPAHLRIMAKAISEAGVKPEIEAFEPGHIVLARRLIDEGFIAAPALFQICLGISYSAPASPQSMIYMRDLLPSDAHWAAFGISRWQFPMVAQAAVLGGHVRVGLEDNLYIDRGVMAPSNAALVERAVQILRLLGFEVATSAEARAILGITSRSSPIAVARAG